MTTWRSVRAEGRLIARHDDMAISAWRAMAQRNTRDRPLEVTNGGVNDASATRKIVPVGSIGS